MNDPEMKIKLSYITGLRSVVLDELNKTNLKILHESDGEVFIEFTEEVIADVKKLRSVTRAYLVLQGDIYHSPYLSKHKSILGNLIEIVIKTESFKTFKVSCAGSDSSEVRSIAKYIQESYNLEKQEKADLKIHIIKPENIW